MPRRPATRPSSADAHGPRRVWRDLVRRFGGRARRRTVGRLPSPSVVTDGHVDHVVDPDGAVMLFRVTGTPSVRTIGEIDRLTESLDARHAVHLDLHDATIPNTRIVRELERLTDRLERALVRVRVVGVDPNHPMLDSRR